VANSQARRRSPVLWLLFSFKGRISRGLYWLAYLFLLAVNSVLIGQLLGGEEASFHDLAATIAPAFVILTLYANLAVAVKRLHDVGYSGFLAAALFIPIVNVAFTIWIGIIPGAHDRNSYGELPDKPPP
jgi:uncharacterized membrane protein YhaH (DUF805 family)